MGDGLPNDRQGQGRRTPTAPERGRTPRAAAQRGLRLDPDLCRVARSTLVMKRTGTTPPRRTRLLTRRVRCTRVGALARVLLRVAASCELAKPGVTRRSPPPPPGVTRPPGRLARILRGYARSGRWRAPRAPDRP